MAENKPNQEEAPTEIIIISEWIPEQMNPGTVFILENAGETGDSTDPFWAVLACPRCGTLGLITRKQVGGLIPITCGSDSCSMECFVRNDITGGVIVPRKPM